MFIHFMKINKPLKKIPSKQKIQDKLKPSFYLLMMAYAFVPVFVPNFNTFDSNGPKFLALAIINLTAFIVIFVDFKKTKPLEGQTRFFRSIIGFAYTLFLLISLLSFFSAINLVESVLNMVKVFTVFVSACSLYVIFSSDRRYLIHLATALTILLLFDSLSVFYNMILYVSREVTSIMDIKSVYSHKNILASAIFVKLPVALYLIFFSDGWKKRLGYIAGLCAILATLMLSTRAFYIGLVLLLIALFLYALLRQIVAGNKGFLRMIAIWSGVFVLAVLLYTAAQRFIFPKNTDTIWNTGIVSRLSSIKAGESSTNARLTLWKWSIQMIREHPTLGVGTGNWKLVELKFENKKSTNYIFGYKNHNDFLEITAETGLLGGITFIAIFILIWISFLRASIHPDTLNDRRQLLFIPAFGMIAYSVDAFFNFPADRPEIQSLFAVYVALGVAFSGMDMPIRHAIDNKTAPGKIWHKYIYQFTLILAVILLIISAWILSLNVKSLYYQRLVNNDVLSTTHKLTASYVVEGFPFIPTVSSFGEPIAVEKAKYFIFENRYQEAIKLLKADASSPYDSRREYYITKAYNLSGNTDIAIVWGQKAYRLKPFDVNVVRALSIWLFNKGKYRASEQILSTYLKQVKTDSEIWTLAANQLWTSGQHEKALIMLDSAVKYMPNDPVIIQKRLAMQKNIKISPYEDLYSQITDKVKAEKYNDAICLLNSFIEKKPMFAEAYSKRAICYHMTGKYIKSIQDIDETFKLGMQDMELLNLRGVNWLRLGKMDAACNDFKVAQEKGNENGALNFKKYCLKKGLKK